MRRNAIVPGVLALGLLLAGCSTAGSSGEPTSPAGSGGGAADVAGLTGVTWHAIAYADASQTIQPVVAGSDPTALFGTDFTISGNATCNSYSGPARIQGNLLQIGPLASTQMACASDALNNQESAFLTALAAAQTWTITAGKLVLRSASAVQVATFEQR
jgi:heat shock protein HslJ